MWKEASEAVTEFLKKIMQPAITLVVLILLLRYSSTASADWGELLFIIKVVLFFWFGYTAIKNFNFTGKEELPKADGAIGGQGSIQKTFTSQGTTASGSTQEQVYQPYIPTPYETVNEIANDDEPEDSNGMAMKFKDKMLYLWDDMTPAQRKQYLDFAINLAKKAWQEFIGDIIMQPVPTEYTQMEPEKLYYGRLKKACGDKWNPTASRGAIDVLHDLLKFQQTGEW